MTPNGVDFSFLSHMYLQSTHRKSAFAALGELRKGLMVLMHKLD